MRGSPSLSPSGVSRWSIGATLVTLVIAALVIWLVAPLREVAGLALRGDASGLRGQLRDLDAWGVAVLLAVMIAHAVIWYPAEILTAAAGFVYGFALALPIVVGGWLLSALATYAMGRYAGRPLLHRIAGERRFRAAQRTIDRGGAPVLLAARLVPVIPFSLTGYVAGAAHVPLWRFSWTTVAGFLPMTLVVVFLGSRLEELSLTDPLLYLALAPIGLLALAARPVARRMRAPAEDEPVAS